jgi:hypothetical protein
MPPAYKESEIDEESKKMKDEKEPHKKVSTCLDDAPSAEMMRNLMGQKGIGSLSEEMMRTLTGKPLQESGERQVITNSDFQKMRRNKMIESLMKLQKCAACPIRRVIESLMTLHKCSTCSIRCQASRKPKSLFARIHRWHATWWPGWKMYQAELGAQRAKNAERV